MPPIASSTVDAQANAEILLWQGRYRTLVLPLVGFATVTLKWFGVISSSSVLAPRFGERPLLVFSGGLLLAYLAVHRLLALYLQRRPEAGLGLVILSSASDVAVLFTVVACVTPPAHYDRALILSILAVQLTQLFFGWTATMATLGLVAVGYTVLVAVAADAGSGINPAEELWTLSLFGIAMLVYVTLQGRVALRMRRLVTLFTRVQEGDLSARYEESVGQMPDPISVVGHAYNRMRAQLETIVLTDPLSGCFNRRGLAQLSEREVSRAVRGRKDLAVLAIDLDHFKRINDEFGHLTGDEVIREIGALLRETAREPDVVARIGGEEFIIVAPESNDEGALILAERVMDALRRHRFHSLPDAMRITTSIGIAAAPARDDEIARTLIARADEALYIAKRNGRDRAVVWKAGMKAFDGTAGPSGRASTPGLVAVGP